MAAVVTKISCLNLWFVPQDEQNPSEQPFEEEDPSGQYILGVFVHVVLSKSLSFVQRD